jgi:hypothetical protein
MEKSENSRKNVENKKFAKKLGSKIWIKKKLLTSKKLKLILLNPTLST